MTTRIKNPDTEADRQLKALLNGHGCPSFVMVAGAGSGKTTSLIKALGHVGAVYGPALRRNGQRVACITYTEVAVGEIRGDVGSDSLFHVSTIHSFLWSLIKPFQRDIAAWVKGRIQEKLTEAREKAANFGSRTRATTRETNARLIIELEAEAAVVEGVGTFTYESGSNYAEGILGHDDIVRMVPQLIQEHRLLASIVAKRYPFFFVDESQDTFPQVVEALKAVDQHATGEFCVGFFGDPMQQVYMTGVGPVVLGPGWKEITKEENFRCPTGVLGVINNIRARGDKLHQVRGRHEVVDGTSRPVSGTAQLFILPADDNRTENLGRVRRYLASKLPDPEWLSDERTADVRVLVIVHRMAAARLGFSGLFAALYDGPSASLKADFLEGAAWPLKPFLDVILPLCAALDKGEKSQVMKVLRANCPKLSKESLSTCADAAVLLGELKSGVEKMRALMSRDGAASIGEVLQFAAENQLLTLDQRYARYLREGPRDSDDPELVATDTVMESYMRCPAGELWGYYEYINDQSPYSTQHGIKGAEFQRVLVVLDDEEGRFPLFSYDKYLGTKELSDKDTQNSEGGKGNVVDRTRRLFYVCCSRATKDLAVVCYAPDVEAAHKKWVEADIFKGEDIHMSEDLPLENGTSCSEVLHADQQST